MKYRKLAWISMAFLTHCTVFQPVVVPAKEIYWLASKIQVQAVSVSPSGILQITKPSIPLVIQSTHLLYKEGAHLKPWPHRCWGAPLQELFKLQLVEGFRQAQAYKMVLDRPAMIAADWQLETQLLTLYQEKQVLGTQIHLHLHWILMNKRTKKIITAHTIERSISVDTTKADADIKAMNQVIAMAIETIIKQVITATHSA